MIAKDVPQFEWEDLVGALLPARVKIANGMVMRITGVPELPELVGRVVVCDRHRFELLAWDDRRREFVARYGGQPRTEA